VGSNRSVYVYDMSNIENEYFARETLATCGRDLSLEGRKYYAYIVNTCGNDLFCIDASIILKCKILGFHGGKYENKFCYIYHAFYHKSDIYQQVHQKSDMYKMYLRTPTYVSASKLPSSGGF
jgi:hypothetical protein